MRRSALLVAVIAVAVATVPPAGRADGDPASDFLLSQDAYTPYAPRASKGAAAALAKSISRVFAGGYRIKVAVIGTKVDLGTIPQLFGKPTRYAKFLGSEIRTFYVGPLLIVMPSGYGIYDGGRSTAAETQVLAKLKPDRSNVDALVRSAADAVDKLLAARALRSKDILPPGVYPRVVFAKPGASVSLVFGILEDSERASAVLTVVAGQKTLATFTFPLQHVVYATPKTVSWHVPDPAPKDLQYCVTAADASGNKSRKSCVPIRTS